jgi:hypothetical protein
VFFSLNYRVGSTQGIPRVIPRSNQFGEGHQEGKGDLSKKDKGKIFKKKYRPECLGDEEINPRK